MEFLNEMWAPFADFWTLTENVLDDTAFGTSFARIVLAIVVFGVLLVVRGLFARFVIGWLKRLAKRTRTTFDDHLIGSLSGPLRFMPIVLGFFLATAFLQLEGTFETIALRLTRSLIVFTLFWGIVAVVDPITDSFGKLREILSTTMLDWIQKALKILIGIIGAAAILQLWGIEIGPLVAGLGLFGLAAALAAQDLFKNLLSGVLILAEKRFEPGEWIKVDGVVEGTVQMIGFRSTMIQQFDKAIVQVPNAKLADTAVINFTRMSHRRIYWKIGVLYDTNADQLREIRDGIEGYILGNDDFASPDEVATFVRIDSFNDSSIDIMVYCFTKTTNWGEWLAIKETLAYKIKEIVEGAGTGFAFPSRSLYVEALPGDKPEVFTPPELRIPTDTPAPAPVSRTSSTGDRGPGEASGEGDGG